MINFQKLKKILESLSKIGFENLSECRISLLCLTGVDNPSGMTIDSAIGKGNTLKKILLSGKSVVEDGSLRPIMAAAMIANIRQGKGLYR